MSLAEIWFDRRSAFRAAIVGVQPADLSDVVARELAGVARAFNDLALDDTQRAVGLDCLRIVERTAILPGAVTVSATVRTGGPRIWLLRPGLGLMTATSALLAAVTFADQNAAAGLALAFIALLGVFALLLTARNAVAGWLAGNSLLDRLPWTLRRILGRRRDPLPEEPGPVDLTYEIAAAAVVEWLDETMRLIDRLVVSVRESAPARRDEWPRNLLLAFRELTAAASTRDAALALLGAEQMRGALLGVGISTVAFSEDRTDWFELVPGGSGHDRTLRPALVRHGDTPELLYRGVHAGGAR